MARVTVEDCLEHVENRFSLVHLASERTKQLFKGSRPLVPCKNREAVAALREIADGFVKPEHGDLDDTTDA
jgi:DNA-directed RNA polymerase subunit omega